MITYAHQREPRFANRYEFGEAGDKIPSHSHPPSMYHDIKVLEGAVLVNGILMLRGDWMVPENDKPHEIIALVPGTVTIHEYLNGEPEEYKPLTLDQLKGVVP